MIEHFKTKLWDLLKEKRVSLAILYDRKGNILWSRGRQIVGKNIETGQGFSKSYLNQAIKNKKTIEEENVILANKTDDLPESARILKIKSLIIQPVGHQFYLYIDSGIKESFNDADREIFKTVGSLLSEILEQIKKSEQNLGGIAGKSAKAELIRNTVLKYSIEEDPVLLLGETGSGKSHIAELIHTFSGRKGKFITIHTPSIPDNLFESEIFGHKKGAFTGAITNKKGYVHQAKGGTLFFDEISEVPTAFQAKLLRFIESKKYTILGDSEEKHADIRIVAATNKNLKEAIRNKEFREDLYYRLQVLEIEIPPLRERKEDIKELILEKQKYLKGKSIGDGFWEAMFNYNWPGNIRELITTLKRLGIHGENTLTKKDVFRVTNQIHSIDYNTLYNQKIEKIWADIKSGISFWDSVKVPFLKRHLNNDEVKTIVSRGLNETNGTYKDVIKLFNLKEREYKKFMNFLNVHKIMNPESLY